MKFDYNIESLKNLCLKEMYCFQICKINGKDRCTKNQINYLIEVYCNDYSYKTRIRSDKLFLLDMISISAHSEILSRLDLSYYFTDESMSRLDPLYVHFNKIILAYLCSFSNEYALRQLKTLEKASIEILNLHIDSATSEELEELLNPSFYNSGVHYFNIKLKGIFEISDSSLQNLSKILFKRLSLIFSGKLVSKFDYQNAWQNFCKVISHFDNISINTTIGNNYTDNCILVFKNTIVKLRLKSNDNLFIKCDSFNCSFQIDELNSRYHFSSLNEVSSKNIEFLYLSNILHFEITNSSKIKNPEEIKQAENLFEDTEDANEENPNFELLLKDLETVELHNKSIDGIVRNEEYAEAIKKLSKAPKINCSLQFCNTLCEIYKLLSSLPLKTVYEFNLNNILTDDIYNSDYGTHIKRDWSSMRIKCLNISSVLSDEDLSLILSILKSSKTLGWYELISLSVCKLSDCLELLDICSRCFNIKKIILKYGECDVEDHQNSISNAIKNTISKLGIIEELKVQQIEKENESGDYQFS